jgi:hypothetical protein
VKEEIFRTPCDNITKDGKRCSGTLKATPKARFFKCDVCGFKISNKDKLKSDEEASFNGNYKAESNYYGDRQKAKIEKEADFIDDDGKPKFIS